MTRLIVMFLAFATSNAANICGVNATVGAHVMSVLNLTIPALAPVAAAAARGDLDAACEALAEYYISSGTAAWLRKVAPTPSDRLVLGIAQPLPWRARPSNHPRVRPSECVWRAVRVECAGHATMRDGLYGVAMALPGDGHSHGGRVA